MFSRSQFSWEKIGITKTVCISTFLLKTHLHLCLKMLQFRENSKLLRGLGNRPLLLLLNLSSVIVLMDQHLRTIPCSVKMLMS